MAIFILHEYSPLCLLDTILEALTTHPKKGKKSQVFGTFFEYLNLLKYFINENMQKKTQLFSIVW